MEMKKKRALQKAAEKESKKEGLLQMVIFREQVLKNGQRNGLKTLDIPRMKALYYCCSREKKGFLGLFGKKPAQVDVEPIAETTVAKITNRPMGF